MLTYSVSPTAQPTEIMTNYKDRHLSDDNSLFKLASEIIQDSKIQRAYKKAGTSDAFQRPGCNIKEIQILRNRQILFNGYIYSYKIIRKESIIY